ncbi:hypothetical protein HYV82_06385 [Candidatus Woesearchaeota archaeon]|nr:hypothetical protein [Candidatus Woesearchaeota archaeon]
MAVGSGTDMTLLRMHLDQSALSHNFHRESSVDRDWRLTEWILEHPVLKGVMNDLITGTGRNGRRGIMAEIGSYLGVTFHLFTGEYAGRLPETLFIGVDKGDYDTSPCSTIMDKGFSGVEERVLFDRDAQVAFNPDRSYQEPGIRVFQDRNRANAFIVYKTSPETLFSPGARLDLVLMKCMLGYVPLSYVQDFVFPMADRVFIFDYIGRCEYKRTVIPGPECIEAALTAAGMSVQMDVGQHYVAIAGARG